jgi:hypothetical protein
MAVALMGCDVGQWSKEISSACDATSSLCVFLANVRRFGGRRAHAGRRWAAAWAAAERRGRGSMREQLGTS